jgi:hypothetical protein
VTPPIGPADLAVPPSLTPRSPEAVNTRSAAFSATVNPNGLPTTVHFEYGLDTSYGSSTAEQPVGSDRTGHTITAKVTGLLPNALYHVRAVASNAAGRVPGNDQLFKTRADPPPPPPTLGATVNVFPVSGTVFVKPPGGAVITALRARAAATQALAPVKGQGFVPLTEARQVPVGSELDTRGGTVRLATATGVKRQTQSGDFQGAVFKTLQSHSRRVRGLTTLTIVEGAFKGAPSYSQCATAGKAQAAPSGSATSARLSSRVVQLLRSNVHGRFSTRGRYSAATVRGTRWDTVDRCDGTLTRVQRGVVVVRDFRAHRNIVLRAGKSYLARAA